MSAKVNTSATEDIEFECPCEGAPHEKDTVTVKSQYGYGDLTDIQAKCLRFIPVKQDDGTTQIQAISDPAAEHYALLEVAIQGWTFLEDDGSPIPVSADNIRALRDEIGNAIGARVNALYLESKRRQLVPNPSSGRSRPSSPGTPANSLNREQRRALKHSTRRSSSAPAGQPTS